MSQEIIHKITVPDGVSRQKVDRIQTMLNLCLDDIDDAVIESWHKDCTENDELRALVDNLRSKAEKEGYESMEVGKNTIERTTGLAYSEGLRDAADELEGLIEE